MSDIEHVHAGGAGRGNTVVRILERKASVTIDADRFGGKEKEVGIWFPPRCILARNNGVK